LPNLPDLKQKHRAIWASGDYNQIAQGILAVADHVVRCGRIRAGESVLDIAFGTGNTA
jgi:ubiquinone/menaquinone biosynthesis C-methylase UbiE